MTSAGAEALPVNDRLAAAPVPSRAELQARHEDYLATLDHDPGYHHRRRRGLRAVLDALEAAGGDSWQARWHACGAEADPRAWLARLTPGRPELAAGGLRFVFADRVVQPSLDWFFQHRLFGLAGELGRWRDAEDFARFHRHATTTQVTGRLELDAANVVARLLVHTSKRMDELTTRDLLGYQQAAARWSTPARGFHTAHELLRGLGVPGVTGPLPSAGVARRQGQLPVEQLVDRYHVACQSVRDVLVRYLQTRSVAMDYGSLRVLCHRLVRLFWADLEAHHPGISSLRLDAEVARQWKQRLRSRLDGQPRRDWSAVFLEVRAFYLDIAQWALTEPEVWAAWVAPSPVTEQDLVGMRKHWRQREARTHQRTRALAALLPRLVRAIEQRQRHTEALLAAIREAAPGEEVVVDGRRYQRPAPPRSLAQQRRAARSLVAVDLDGDGRHLDVVGEEDDAFWAWAATEVLRLTGVRREELQELTHLAVRQYRQPDGKLVLLLQVAPSKTDRERVVPVAPELAHVLARVVARIKDHHGRVPLVERYDPIERTISAPLPYLFQRRRRAGTSVVVSDTGLRDLLARAVRRAGLRDTDGTLVRLTPHDYRRIFATDAVAGGLPVHIAAKILGHLDLNTTRGYAAVYPDDVIAHLQAFMARRRASRPAEEYREPTAVEWAEFEAHFGKRTMELGWCRRPYGTPCVHEHACIRCPMLEVAPAMKPRLLEIQTSTRARLDLATTRGWLGEVEALEVNLHHIGEKLAQVERAEARHPQVTSELLTVTAAASDQ